MKLTYALSQKMARSTPFLSIAICTYNRRQYLEDTLRDVSNFNASKNDAEIIVIDNNSTDGTSELLRSFPWISPMSLRFYYEEKQGLSHARNRAITEAHGEFILFIDDDILAPNDFVQHWTNAIADKPGLIGAGGRIQVHFDDENPEWFPPILHTILGHHFPYKSTQRYRSQHYPFGGNMLLNLSWVRQSGMFNAKLGRNGKSLGAGEEKALFNMMKKQTTEVWFFPECWLKHRISSKRLTFEYFLRQAFGLGVADRVQSKTIQDHVRWNAHQSIKVLGTLAYSIRYFLSGKVMASKMLLRFRFNLIRGYYSPQN